MPIRKLMEFLDENGVKYVTIRHSIAYTAQEVAAAAHVPGKQIAKTVIVDVDGALAMAVVRGPDKIDLDLLRGAAGVSSATIAAESAFAARFPGVEPGAMPPFGNLFEMPVYVDEALTRDERIAFNAGTHTELVQMAYADLARLVAPKVARFTR